MNAGCSAIAVKIKEQRDLSITSIRGGDIEEIFPGESVVRKGKGKSAGGITRLFFGAVLIVPAP
jgi:hypothetical protein